MSELAAVDSLAEGVVVADFAHVEGSLDNPTNPSSAKTHHNQEYADPHAIRVRVRTRLRHTPSSDTHVTKAWKASYFIELIIYYKARAQRSILVSSIRSCD